MKRPSGGRGRQLAKVAPLLNEITQEMLYDVIWERPLLSKRERSVITSYSIHYTKLYDGPPAASRSAPRSASAAWERSSGRAVRSSRPSESGRNPTWRQWLSHWWRASATPCAMGRFRYVRAG